MIIQLVSTIQFSDLFSKDNAVTTVFADIETFFTVQNENDCEYTLSFPASLEHGVEFSIDDKTLNPQNSNSLAEIKKGETVLLRYSGTFHKGKSICRVCYRQTASGRVGKSGSKSRFAEVVTLFADYGSIRKLGSAPFIESSISVILAGKVPLLQKVLHGKMDILFGLKNRDEERGVAKRVKVTHKNGVTSSFLELGSSLPDTVAVNVGLSKEL